MIWSCFFLVDCVLKCYGEEEENVSEDGWGRKTGKRRGGGRNIRQSRQSPFCSSGSQFDLQTVAEPAAGQRPLSFLQQLKVFEQHREHANNQDVLLQDISSMQGENVNESLLKNRVKNRVSKMGKRVGKLYRNILRSRGSTHSVPVQVYSVPVQVQDIYVMPKEYNPNLLFENYEHKINYGPYSLHGQDIQCSFKRSFTGLVYFVSTETTSISDDRDSILRIKMPNKWDDNSHNIHVFENKLFHFNCTLFYLQCCVAIDKVMELNENDLQQFDKDIQHYAEILAAPHDVIEQSESVYNRLSQVIKNPSNFRNFYNQGTI